MSAVDETQAETTEIETDGLPVELEDPEVEVDHGDVDELGDEELRHQALEQQAVTDEDIERMTRQLEQEAARHAKRIAAIMGDQVAELVRCVLCPPQIGGFRYPVVPEEAQREAVKQAIGIGNLDRFREATDAQRCATCEGLGQVRSGSEVVGEQTLRCLSCQGKGWTSAAPQRQGQQAPAAIAHVEPDANTPLEAKPDLDPWGTPPDDPDYGKMPNFRSAEGQQRLAARLAAS